jgi:hypothetical protein
MRLEAWEGPASVASLVGLNIFFLLTVGVAFRHLRTLFLDTHGWSHRLAGAAHLSWLVYGCLTTTITVNGQVLNPKQALLYDIVLGCLGVTATLTAAKDFPHRYVRNTRGQSGTLSEKAMVTHGEMMEHAFYQFLNLWQALYLHLLAWNSDKWTDWQRWIALFGVTAPWLSRRRFPVNSFSNNWKKTPVGKQSDMETLLYRIKKGQYLFYKHVVLHGVNLALCLHPSDLVYSKTWRIFWLSLNTAYAMEFFLQSLVRRKVLRQDSMLWLNRLLMVVSSLAATQAIMTTVRWELCLASLLLNFINRHHDVLNTMVLGSGMLLLNRLWI